MFPGQGGLWDRRGERACNVALSVGWCQPGLAWGGSNTGERLGGRDGPVGGEVLSEKGALVIAALTDARLGEGDWNNQGAFLLDIGGPGEAGHSDGDLGGGFGPVGVFQGVQNGGCAGMRGPADGAGCTDEWWEDLAPVAGVAPLSGVATAGTLRVWEMGEAGPTEVADQTGVGVGQKFRTGDADSGKEETGGSFEDRRGCLAKPAEEWMSIR